MEDNIRAVMNIRKMTAQECAAVRKRAIAGQGVYTGTTLVGARRRESALKVQ